MSLMYMLNRARDTTPPSATPVCMLQKSWYGYPATAFCCLCWEPNCWLCKSSYILTLHMILVSTLFSNSCQSCQTSLLVNITMAMLGLSMFSGCKSCEHVSMLVGDTPGEQHYTLSWERSLYATYMFQDCNQYTIWAWGTVNLHYPDALLNLSVDG